MSRQYIKPRSDCGTSGEFISMGFTNIVSAFVMLLGASLAAVVFCVAEFLVKRRQVNRPEEREEGLVEIYCQ